jgi:DNA polymerase-1
MGCRTEQAEQIVEALFGKFRKLHAWTRGCLAHARKHGDAWTWWAGTPARRRDLVDIGEQDENKRGSAENSSWNTPVQGTASDFCLASVIEVVRWLHEDAVPARLVLTVHDSLLLEVREDALDEVASQVRRIMRSWPSEGVPLDVDMEVGPNWGDLHRYEEPVRATLRALGADPNQADPA